MRHSLKQDNTYYFLNDLDVTISGSMQEVVHDDPLSLCIIQARGEEEYDPKLVKQTT